MDATVQSQSSGTQNASKQARDCPESEQSGALSTRLFSLSHSLSLAWSDRVNGLYPKSYFHCSTPAVTNLCRFSLSLSLKTLIFPIGAVVRMFKIAAINRLF